MAESLVISLLQICCCVCYNASERILKIGQHFDEYDQNESTKIAGHEHDGQEERTNGKCKAYYCLKTPLAGVIRALYVKRNFYVSHIHVLRFQRLHENAMAYFLDHPGHNLQLRYILFTNGRPIPAMYGHVGSGRTGQQITAVIGKCRVTNLSSVRVCRPRDTY